MAAKKESINALRLLHGLVNHVYPDSLSWDRVQKDLGWSRSTCARARSGDVLPARHARAVAGVFGVCPEWVLSPTDLPVTVDGRPWIPDKARWIGVARPATIEELAYGEALSTVVDTLRKDRERAHFGDAAYGIIALAHKLDPDRMSRASFVRRL